MTLTGLLDGLPEDAVHTVDRSVPRAEVVAAADALAQALAGAGVAPGTVVAGMMPNRPETVAGLFGVWRAGAVYAPLNPRAADTEVTRLLEQLRPGAVLVTAEQADRFAGSGLPVVVSDGLTWTVRPAGGDTAAEPLVHDPGVALLQFTSGTTGTPKPVTLRHEGVLDLIDKLLGSLKGSSRPRDGEAARPPMPNLVPVSLSLWAGIYQVLFAFRAGAPVVLMDRFSPAEFAVLVDRFQLRSTVLPPAALAMLADDPAVTDLTPLRIVRSITAPLSPVQARRFNAKFGVTVLNSYGQTELGGEVVGWNARDAREFGVAKLGSVGRPLPGIEVRIDDGEIVVRTPATAAGRVDPAFADRLSADGWFRTGDLGLIDEDGFVWLDGRVSDMINRGGLKVFPGHVEEVLLAAPGVRDAAVAGVPDDRLGEVPWAFVVTDGDPDEAALIAWCREHLTPYKVPVRVVGVAALPRNELGKVVRRDLVARAAAE